MSNAVRLHLSESIPLREDNTVEVPPSVLAAMHTEAQPEHPPPNYNLYHLDEVYAGVDPSGFRTPRTPGARDGVAHTVPGTPFHGPSRSGSGEHIPALVNPAVHAVVPANSAPSAADLSSRLRRLSLDESSLGAGAGAASSQAGAQGGRAMQPHTAAPSRRNSGRFSDALAITQADYDMVALSRTPSYNTAVRTPAPATPTDDLPPSYEAATSRPVTPTHSQRRLGTAPRASSLAALLVEAARNTARNSRRESPTSSPRQP